MYPTSEGVSSKVKDLRAEADAKDALGWLGRRLAWEDLMRSLAEPAEPSQAALDRSA